MKFNEKLKSLREAKGYTQDEIASKLNISRQSVSKWEQGINEPDFETTKKLCQILDCTLEDLIDDDREIVSSEEERREKTAKKIFLAGIAITIFSVLLTFAFLALPYHNIVTHFDGQGNPVYGDRAWLLLMLFPISLGLLINVLVRLFSDKDRFHKEKKVQMQVIALIVEIVISITAIVLMALSTYGSTATIDYLHFVSATVMALVATISPFAHPRFNPRNALIGFRSNFTLSNQKGWEKVNAFSSIVLTASSSVGYLFTLIFIHEHWVLVFLLFLLGGMVACVIQHAVIKRKLTKR